MTRSFVSTGAIALATALGAGACADNGDELLLILNNIVPTEDECVLSGEEEGTFRNNGSLDVLGGEGYLFTPLVKNTASTETATEAQRTVFVRGAQVDLRFEPSPFDEQELQDLEDSAITRFEVPLAGAISPNGGTSPLAFQVMQKPLVIALRDELSNPDDRILVLADVRIRATMGGGTIFSNTFEWSVEVCEGCDLVNLGPCATLPSSFEPTISNPCNPFQDGTTTCCTVDDELQCPAFGTGG